MGRKESNQTNKNKILPILLWHHYKVCESLDKHILFDPLPAPVLRR